MNSADLQTKGCSMGKVKEGSIPLPIKILRSEVVSSEVVWSEVKSREVPRSKVNVGCMVETWVRFLGILIAVMRGCVV